MKADPAMPAPSDTSVIAFGIDHCGDYRQTRRQILTALAARGWPITYTTGPHFVWDVTGPKWRNAPWRSGYGRSDGVILNWPGRTQARWPRLATWDARVGARFIAALQRQAGWRDARNRVAVVFHPLFAPYVERLGTCRVVYYADDSFSKMPSWTHDLGEWERFLVERADLIVAISQGVARNLPAGGPERARILPNGAEVEIFMRGASEPCPVDLAGIPRPRIGHVGSINPKLDLCLVDALSERRPDWQWVFIGHVVDSAIDADAASREPWHRLARRPNVHVLGRRPYRTLPAYEAHMDVNTMLYRTDPGGWWQDVSPLKLHEYLAVGQPVVATEIEALDPVRDLIAFARDPEEWIAAVERALTDRDARPLAAWRAAARANDWATVAERFEAWLTPLLATSPSSPG